MIKNSTTRAWAIVFIIVAMPIHYIYAQLPSIPEVSPPSPTAYSFLKYGDIPVSHYTGTANISIPVFNVMYHDLFHNISLNYHTGGHKVQEEASWVGIGWNLAAGGVITRTVRGLVDEKAQYRYEIFADTVSMIGNQNFLNHVSGGLYDAEPDLFLINIGDITAKFILIDGEPKFVDHRDLKVICHLESDNNYTFEVIDDKGVRYFFEHNGVEVLNYFEDSAKSYRSSWFVTRIESANGLQTMTFEYEDETITATRLVSDVISSPNSTAHSFCGSQTASQSFSATFTYAKRLSYIETPNLRIDFEEQTAPRKDMPLSDTRALDRIVVTDRFEGKELKRFQFNYEPIPEVSSNARLRLLSFLEVAGDEEAGHEFEYTAQSLPPKSSSSQDHWGYYNGKNNTSLIPRTDVGFGKYIGTANREPDPAFVMAGMLKKVIYPTKGWTEFEYGANSYATMEPVKTTAQVIASASGPIGGGGNYVSQQKNFEIMEGVNAELTLALYMPEGEYVIDDNSTLTRIEILQIVGATETSVHSHFITQGSDNRTVPVTLAPGSYKLVASTYYPGTNAYGQLQYTYYSDELEPIEKYGPGVRVNAIRSKADDTSPVIVKKYGYEGAVFQGKEPEYLSTSFSELAEYSICRSCWYDVVSSSSKVLYLPSPDYLLYYTKVSEYNGEHTDLGKIVYKYEVMPNQQILLRSKSTFSKVGDTYYPVSRDSTTYGSMMYKSYTGTVITEVDSYQCINPHQFYRANEIPTFVGWNYPLKQYHTLYNTMGVSTTLATVTEYAYGTNHHYPVTTKTSRSDGLEQRTLMKFPQDYAGVHDYLLAKNIVSLPTELQSWMWDGAALRLLHGTIHEYDATYLKPSKTYNLELPTPVSSYDNELKDLTGKFTTLIPDSRFEEKLSLIYGGTNGVITSKVIKGNFPTTYLWGYAESEIIAKVENASVGSIFHTSFEEDIANVSTTARTGKLAKNGVYQKTLSGLSNGEYILSYFRYENNEWKLSTTDVSVSNGLFQINISGHIDELRFYPKQAAMTTYTYDLGIGMTSQTDANNVTTYYEYDSFGRLKLVRDKDRNILKTYEYHYKEGSQPAN